MGVAVVAGIVVAVGALHDQCQYRFRSLRCRLDLVVRLNC